MGSAQAETSLRRKVDIDRATSQERKILNQRQVGGKEIFYLLRLSSAL